MKISDLFNRSSVYNTERNTETQKAAQEESARTVRREKAGEDRISISPQARQFKQISEIVAEDQKSNASRIAALKSQVESGQYSVQSTEVAKSMLSFLKEQ